MPKTVLYMSMSLDGFITGPDDGMDHPLGRDGQRLHSWLAEGDGVTPGSHLPSDDTSATVFHELMSTGAVITGRRTFEQAGEWGGDHHDGVPIFVLTHTVPDRPAPGVARYVTEPAAAAAQAKEAAGELDVMVHGATTAQSLLRAGLLDEMEIHLVPVLLGQGRRLFDNLGADHIELALTRTLQAPDVCHLRYRTNPR